MASWRDVKAEARRVVHDTMRIPFAFYPAGELPSDSNSTSEAAIAPVVYGRLHLSDRALGDQAGTNLNSAEAVEPTPKIIFWLAELAEKNIVIHRNDVFCVAPGEAYEIDHVEPHDVETVTAKVTRMRGASAAPFLPPEVEQ